MAFFMGGGRGREVSGFMRGLSAHACTNEGKFIKIL